MAPHASVVRLPLGFAAMEGSRTRSPPPFAILYSGREIRRAMIVLLHPRTGRPANRRFPLAILSIAAVLEGKEEYTIVDGNLDSHPDVTLARLFDTQPIEAVAVSVM